MSDETPDLEKRLSRPENLIGPDRPASPKSPVMAGAGATVSATLHAGPGPDEVGADPHEHHWFAPPTKPVGPAYIAMLVVAQLVFFIALLGPAIIAIAVKVQQIVPEDEKVGALSLVTSVGAIAAFLGNVLFGRFSDRTTSRFGRRRPWLIGGTIAMTGAFFVMATTESVPVLALGWFLAQAGANACFSPFIASVADQVPQVQRGKVSALLGIAQSVGVLGGVYLASTLTKQMVLLFVGPSVAAILVMFVYAFVLKDQQLKQKPPKMDLKEWGQTFWVSPKKHPDFAWAWLSRFLITLGSFMFSTYRLFFLQDRVHLSAEEAAATISTGVLIYTVVLVGSGYLGGWLSDKTGKRKMLVFISAAIFAVGCAGLAVSHSVMAFFIVEAIMGLSYGIYVGVDLALVMDVLPNPDDSGKDLGVFNIANAMPQTLAPGIGGLLVGLGGGGNYNAMFIGSGIFCLIGAAVILFVKKVK